MKAELGRELTSIAWRTLCLGVGVAIGLLIIRSLPNANSLDKAQKTFEHSADWPTPGDFDAWRALGTMKCRDVKTLRICEATWQRYAPDDGKPIGKDRVAFACSPEICAWVDP
jgi:hypothetical protein